MKKVGLILANPITNYGAHLQAYATQYAVDQLGVSTEVIDISKLNTKRYLMDLGFIAYALKRIVHKFLGEKERTDYDNEFLENVKKRTELASDFRKRRLHDEYSYRTYDELVEASKKYDAVMLGSDQMWTPGASFSPINSLAFVPEGVSRLSYATSLGVEEYPRSCWHSARKMWKGMDAVSVREQQGGDIINKVCSKQVDVQVVLDPTYLLTKEQWESLIPMKKMLDEKYVFCYFLADNVAGKRSAVHYAKSHGLKLVSILSCESLGTMDRTYADQTLGALSPEDFINWLRGAECIFTDSFHGVAFSVINEKQFFVFYRVRKDGLPARNSRIDNVLKMWKCEERLVKELGENENKAKSVDYQLVRMILDSQRKKSMDYLKKALAL